MHGAARTVVTCTQRRLSAGQIEIRPIKLDYIGCQYSMISIGLSSQRLKRAPKDLLQSFVHRKCSSSQNFSVLRSLVLRWRRRTGRELHAR